MKVVKYLVPVLLILGVVGFLSIPATGATLRDPYHLPENAKKYEALEEVPECDNAPKPLPKLETVSKYDQSDATKSKISKQGEAQFRKDIEPMDDMVSLTMRHANRYLLSDGKKRSAAYCVVEWLYGWAKADALDEIHNDKSYNTVGKYLGGMALAYLQVWEAPGLDAQKKQVIGAWLAGIAEDLAGFVDSRPEAKASRNNHRHWSGLGVAAAGIAAGRQDLFDWGMEAARVGLRQVQPDGTLPLELERDSRARDYHLYAVTPLVILAEVGLANGVNLYAEENGALHRLARLVVETTDDPTFFEEKTGKKQLDYPDAGTRASRLAWMEPYHARFPDSRMEALLRDIRPVTAKFIGGRLSELYTHPESN